MSSFSTELAKIELLTVAGQCDAHDALEAVVRAVASLEHVSGVDVAVKVGSKFVSAASSGVDRLTGREHLQVYADCFTKGRLLRCDHAASDPCAHGTPFSSMILTPLTQQGHVIGVLAVYSDDPGVFGLDYIVPLGTAAVICSVLAPQVLERGTEKQTNAVPPPVSELGTVVAPVDELELDNQQGPFPGSELQAHESSAEEAPLAGTTPVDVRSHDLHLTVANQPGKEFEEAIRSALASPDKQVPQVLALRKGRAAWSFRSPLVIAPLLLLLSGVVFGSMQWFRFSGAATKQAKTTPVAARSVTVTKLLGATKPMRGVVIPADAQITKGRLIQDGLPAYPTDALNRSIEGDVTAILIVSERGSVEDVRVTEGNPLLSSSVLSTLSHWRFAPFETNGRAIPVEIPVIVAFHISVETMTSAK